MKKILGQPTRKGAVESNRTEHYYVDPEIVRAIDYREQSSYFFFAYCNYDGTVRSQDAIRTLSNRNNRYGVAGMAMDVWMRSHAQYAHELFAKSKAANALKKNLNYLAQAEKAQVGAGSLSGRKV